MAARVMYRAPTDECVAVGGGVDYLIKVETETIDAYQRLFDAWLTGDAGIERYFTYIVTKTVKRPALGFDAGDFA